MKFEIEVTVEGRKYRMSVERINVTSVSEQFIISAQRGKKQITIISDRPYYRNNPKIPSEYPRWMLVEGQIKDREHVNRAFFHINNYLDFGPDPWQMPPKPKEDVFIKTPKKEKGEGRDDDWGTRRKTKDSQ